jgi:hypothetical protein
MGEYKLKLSNITRKIKTIRNREEKRAECSEVSSYIKLLLFLTLKQLFRSVAALNRHRKMLMNVHMVPVTMRKESM